MVKAFEKASDKTVAYKVAKRGLGDFATCYTDPALDNQEIGWSTEITDHNARGDMWRWQSQNPIGFDTIRKI